MVTLIIDKVSINDTKKILHAWFPLFHKHGEVQFIINSSDILLPSAKNLSIENDLLRNLIKRARNKTVFVTDVTCLPTYRMMTLLSLLGDRNCTIIPRWHEYSNPILEGSETNSYSVLRDQYNGESIKEYITKYSPKIYNKGEMYFV